MKVNFESWIVSMATAQASFSNYTKTMPPKKKKGKKGKKKGGDGASPGPEETGEPSEKEIMLQAE